MSIWRCRDLYCLAVGRASSSKMREAFSSASTSALCSAWACRRAVPLHQTTASVTLANVMLRMACLLSLSSGAFLRPALVLRLTAV